MSKKVDPSKLQAVFERMMQDDQANRFCADCHAKNPRWASTNLGVFICIKCAGIHRSIGTHITKVKSISLDAWEESQLAVMRRVGNTNGRRIWEATMPESVQRERPNENASSATLDHWIRAKYERKLYFSQKAYDEVFKGPAPAAAQATAAPAPAAAGTAGRLNAPPQRGPGIRRPSGSSRSELMFDVSTPAAAPQQQQQQPAGDLFGVPVVAPPVAQTAAAAAQPVGRPRAPSGGAPAPAPAQTAPAQSMDSALFGTSTTAAPQAAPRDSMSDLLFGSAPAAAPAAAAPAQSKDTSAIMALFGTMPSTPMVPTQPQTMQPQTMQPMPMQTQQQQQHPQQQQQQPRGNYDVDLRAYGVYRAPTAQQQQQMSAQQRAYYQQQYLLMQQQQQRYTPNYTRFA